MDKSKENSENAPKINEEQKRAPTIKFIDLDNEIVKDLPESGSPVTFEEVLDKLGCFGPFQVLTLCTYFLLEIACAFVVFIPVLVGKSTVERNCTEIEEIGEVQTNADFHTYTTAIYDVMENASDFTPETTPFPASISPRSIFGSFSEMWSTFSEYESVVDEWNLVCDRAWVPDVFTSCLSFGMIVGNIIASQIADWYGRRTTYIGILIVMGIGTALSAFSPSIYVYAFSRMISGAAFCGYMNVATMAILEFMSPKWRSVGNCCGPIGEGIMLLSLLGYYIKPWRMLYVATLAPYIILIIPVYLYMPEGPRWLLRNNRVTEAHNVLNYMAKVNGRKPISRDVLEAIRRQEQMADESQKDMRISYCDFLGTRTLLVTTVYLFALWFSWNVAYYGISYNIRNVPGDRYINLALVGLANAVGQRVSYIICDWLGRRKAVLLSMTFSASFLVTLAICFLTMKHVNHYIILVGCFCGIVGMSSNRACARLLSGESFPTAVRTMGLGLGGLGANIAGLVTPQLAFLGSQWPPLPFFVFATVAVTGSLVVFMMKETNGSPLSDDVQIGRNKKKPQKGDV